MNEKREPYENTLSIEDLRREVRRGWDLEHDMMKALRDLPEVPSYRVLLLLSGAAKFPDDANIGKQLQATHGREVIPYKLECEMGAGLWSRIRNGVLPQPAAERFFVEEKAE